MTTYKVERQFGNDFTELWEEIRLYDKDGVTETISPPSVVVSADRLNFLVFEHARGRRFRGEASGPVNVFRGGARNKLIDRVPPGQIKGFEFPLTGEVIWVIHFPQKRITATPRRGR